MHVNIKCICVIAFITLKNWLKSINHLLVIAACLVVKQQANHVGGMGRFLILWFQDQT